jgi:Protein of unknown function (DUF2934)
MPRAKSPRTAKVKTDNKVIEMPEKTNGRNGFTSPEVESQIRVRAYELYQQRGDAPGSEVQDWLAAEREVMARHSDQSHTA